MLSLKPNRTQCKMSTDVNITTMSKDLLPIEVVGTQFVMKNLITLQMKLKWFTFCKDKREKTQSDDIPHFDKYKDFHFDSLMGSFDMSGYKKQNDDWLCTRDRNIPQNIQCLLQCIDTYPIIYYKQHLLLLLKKILKIMVAVASVLKQNKCTQHLT